MIYHSYKYFTQPFFSNELFRSEMKRNHWKLNPIIKPFFPDYILPRKNFPHNYVTKVWTMISRDWIFVVQQTHNMAPLEVKRRKLCLEIELFNFDIEAVKRAHWLVCWFHSKPEISCTAQPKPKLGRALLSSRKQPPHSSITNHPPPNTISISIGLERLVKAKVLTKQMLSQMWTAILWTNLTWW